MAAQQPANGQTNSRWLRIGAIGAGVVAVVAIASWCTVALTGDDDSSPSDGGDQTATPAATSTTASSPTTAAQTASATPGRTASPAATASAAASPAAATATTAAPTPTRAATIGPTATRAAATTAPTSAPTATTAPTNTPAPTSTPTTAPPTATPTATATPTTAPITNFAGTWHSAGTCPNPAAPYRWSVGLTQQGTVVTGYITFHNCPDGGRAEYSVSGTATSAGTIQLAGIKSLNLGTLGGSTPDQVTFTIAPFGPPSPNYAP